MNKNIDLRSRYPYPALQVSYKALLHNLNCIRNLTQYQSEILIPVKANAYGCGLGPIMKFLKEQKINYVGVANQWEAELVRKERYRQKILLLGSFYRENIDRIIDNRVILSITELEQIKFLNDYARKINKNLEVHIKFDVGMGRLGIKPQFFADFLQLMQQAERLKIGGLFTHFPVADVVDSKETIKQLAQFEIMFNATIKELKLNRKKVMKHSANSHALMNYRQSHFDMVRPGIMFYGYFQNEEEKKRLAKKINIQPCLKLKAKPISVRKLFRGDKISYSSSYTIEDEELSVGVLPIGYADGIKRALSNRVRFENYDLIGNVTMDQIILKGVQDDQAIEVIGKNSPPLEQWASICQTTTYEIITTLGPRLDRDLVRDF